MMTTTLIAIPVARRAARRDRAALELLARLARRAHLAGRGRRVDHRCGAVRLLVVGAPVRPARIVVLGPAGELARRPVPLLALVRRDDGRRDGGVHDLRLVDRARPCARLLRADAPADGRDRRRLHRAGPAALLRLLRGDADPAVHPDRRLGRQRPHEGDDHLRRLHGRRLAADARRDHRLRPPAGDVRHDEDGAVHVAVAVPRVRRRVRDQVAALPAARLAADHLSRVAARDLGGALGRRRQGGPVRPAADRDPVLPAAGPRLAGRHARSSRRSRSSTARCSRSAHPTSAASSCTRRSRRRA